MQGLKNWTRTFCHNLMPEESLLAPFPMEEES
jgi:hypothetical protein